MSDPTKRDEDLISELSRRTQLLFDTAKMLDWFVAEHGCCAREAEPIIERLEAATYLGDWRDERNRD